MSWAAFEGVASRNLAALLPLDEETLKDIVHYAASLSGPDEAAEHFKGLLGNEPASLDFIHGFCSRRWPPKAAQKRSGYGSDNGTTRGGGTKRVPIGAKKVSSSSGLPKPVQPGLSTQRPDIGRGYMKKAEEEDYYVGVKKDKGKSRDQESTKEPTAQPATPKPWTTTSMREPPPEPATARPAPTAPAIKVKGALASPSPATPAPLSRPDSPTDETDELWSAPPPILAKNLSIAYPSESAKEAARAKKEHATTASTPLEPVKLAAQAAPSSQAPMSAPKPSAVSKKKAEGTLTSDLATKKPTTKGTMKSGVGAALAEKNGQKSVKVHSLQEVEDAIRILESEYTDGRQRRMCDCQAQRHPLLEVAPNCLHCGKIICVKEGLGPCTYCHTPLLTKEEYDGLVTELRQERGQLKNEIHNDQSKKSTTGGNSRLTYSGSAGGQPLTTDQAMLPGLDRANDQLSNLLSFQANSVQRTRIIDNASDFELPGSGSDRWLTPTERAMQLRKQQRTLKQMEALEAKRNGRGKRVISIDLRGNKVVAEDHSETDYESEEDDDDNEDVDTTAAVTEQTGAKSAMWNPDRDNGRFIRPSYPVLKDTVSEVKDGAVAKTDEAVTLQADSDDEAMDIDNDGGAQPAAKLVTSSANLPSALKGYIDTINTDSRRSRPTRVQDDFEYDDLATTKSLFDEIGITETVDEETTEAIAQANKRLLQGIRESKYATDRDVETLIRHPSYTESTTRRPAARRNISRVAEYFLDADDDNGSAHGNNSAGPPGPRGSYPAGPMRGYGDDNDFGRSRSRGHPAYSGRAEDYNESDEDRAAPGPSSSTIVPSQKKKPNLPDDEDSTDDESPVVGKGQLTSTDRERAPTTTHAIDSESDSDDDMQDREDILDKYNQFKPKGSNNYVNPYVAPPSPSISSESDGRQDYIDDADDDQQGEDDGIEIIDEPADNTVSADDQSEKKPYGGYVGVVGNDKLSQDPDDYLKQFGISADQRKVKRWGRAKNISTPLDTDGEDGRCPVQDEAYWNAMKRADAEWIPVPSSNMVDDWNTGATKPDKESVGEDLMDLS
ncbi:hypothetical protein V1525DRAFT_241536 [Lipomyces kononenkoae]|uniref:Uncharacterized protein n=1 Tax=Lipomyces kononenkoae TaxID=34357 RepID=A0ACC3SW56_LIPKO